MHKRDESQPADSLAIIQRVQLVKRYPVESSARLKQLVESSPRLKIIQ